MAARLDPVQDLVSSALSRDRIIELWAEAQMERLIDPTTPKEERERRIHRLTEGPPEFVEVRSDLPRNKTNS